ncbi:hypothetical protein CCAE64S_01828 [Castellaniella caeni]
MPASGPSQRDMPDLAAPAAAVPAAAPAAGAAARCVVEAVGGGTAWRCLAILVDWRPKLMPPPMRRAWASEVTDSITSAATSMSVASIQRGKDKVMRSPE